MVRSFPAGWVRYLVIGAGCAITMIYARRYWFGKPCSGTTPGGFSANSSRSARAGAPGRVSS
jgi:hypothetical protein